MEIPYEYKRLEDCSKEDLINKIIVREKHCDDLKELLDKGLKKYKELEEENKMLHKEQGRLHRLWSKDTKHIAELEEENKNLRGEVKDLVERNIELDKKYMLVLKENKKLRLLQIAGRTVEQWLEEGKKVMIATDDGEYITLLDFINLGGEDI